MSHIQAAANSSMHKTNTLNLPDNCRQQCYWWLLNVQAAAHASTIVHPRVEISPTATKGWTDAAGGTTEKVGRGIGGFLPPSAWVYMPWTAWLNKNSPNSEGVRFARKLSCLELVAVLALVSLCSPKIANREVEVFVDNSGSVDIYKKGGSTACLYSYTVAKAISDISRGINARICLSKVTRCSDKGSWAADALSKAEFKLFKELVP